MSNLVHRRRRCARIVTYMVLLPGGQYARGQVLFLPRIKRIERISFEPLNFLNQYLEVRQKPDKPLGEDGGLCPVAMLPLWSYKSELLTPKPEAYHHLPLEGHHPHQGDKQEKTVLPCMWQSFKAYPLAYCPPGSSIECGTILAHLLRRCTRLLMVVPSRHRSACGYW